MVVYSVCLLFIGYFIGLVTLPVIEHLLKSSSKSESEPDNTNRNEREAIATNVISLNPKS